MDVLGCSYGAMVDSGWKCTTPWQHGCEMEEMEEIREKLGGGEGREASEEVCGYSDNMGVLGFLYTRDQLMTPVELPL